MYVADRARGRGVGKALMAALIERARELPDLDAILLSVAASQAAAQKLYSSLGFEAYGLERGALRIHDQKIDEHYMQLTLRKRD